MGTAILFMDGTASADGKIITLYGSHKKAHKASGTVWKFVDQTTQTFELYRSETDGKEMKMMEITKTQLKTARLRKTQSGFLAATVAMFSLSILTACRPTPHVAVDHVQLDSAVSGLPVPQDVRRLAVWYPRTWEQDVAYGYSRLEQAAFELKRQRSWIKIVERRNIELLIDEQRLQLSGRVADDSAVRIGKLLGADSMLCFRVDMPSWRDRMLARFYGRMPPLVVSSKIISVESGEVLYHDTVIIRPTPLSGEWDAYASDYELQPALRSALDHALSGAIAHLHQSFR